MDCGKVKSLMQAIFKFFSVNVLFTIITRISLVNLMLKLMKVSFQAILNTVEHIESLIKELLLLKNLFIQVSRNLTKLYLVEMLMMILQVLSHPPIMRKNMIKIKCKRIFKIKMRPLISPFSLKTVRKFIKLICQSTSRLKLKYSLLHLEQSTGKILLEKDPI